jgi:hypothetical protein
VTRQVRVASAAGARASVTMQSLLIVRKERSG